MSTVGRACVKTQSQKTQVGNLYLYTDFVLVSGDSALKQVA